MGADTGNQNSYEPPQAVQLTSLSPLSGRDKLQQSKAIDEVSQALGRFGYTASFAAGALRVSPVSSSVRPCDAPAALTIDTFLGGLTRERTGYGYKPKIASSITFANNHSSRAVKAASAPCSPTARPPSRDTACEAVAKESAPVTVLSPQLPSRCRTPVTSGRFSRLAQSVDTLHSQIQISVGSLGINKDNLLALHEKPTLALLRPCTAPSKASLSSRPATPTCDNKDVTSNTTALVPEPTASCQDREPAACQTPEPVSVNVVDLWQAETDRPSTPCGMKASVRPCTSRPITPASLCNASNCLIPQPTATTTMLTGHDRLQGVGPASLAAQVANQPALLTRPATPLVDLTKGATDALRPASRQGHTGCGSSGRPFTADPSTLTGSRRPGAHALSNFKPTRGHTLVVFQHMDKDGNGKVTLSELEDASLAVGFTLDQAHKLFKRLDKAGKGFLKPADWGSLEMQQVIELFSTVYMQRFMGLPGPTALPEQVNKYVAMQELKSVRSMAVALQLARDTALARGARAASSSGNVVFEAFRFMDTDGNGKLSFEELRDGFYALGVYVNDTVMQKIMEHFDDDKDSQVNYFEFVQKLFADGRSSSLR